MADIDVIHPAADVDALASVISLAGAGKHASDYDDSNTGDHLNPIRIHTELIHYESESNLLQLDSYELVYRISKIPFRSQGHLSD